MINFVTFPSAYRRHYFFSFYSDNDTLFIDIEMTVLRTILHFATDTLEHFPEILVCLYDQNNDDDNDEQN